MIGILSRMIAVCEVISVNYEKATVRVKIPSRNVLSGNLKLLKKRTLNNKEYDMYDIGEQVLCLFLPHGNFVNGYVIGATYNNVDIPSNLIGKGIKSYLWKDGSYVSYDENTGNMTVNAVGNVSITSGNVVTIKAKKMLIDVEGDVDIISGGSFGVSASESNFDNIINSPDIVTDKGSHNLHIHKDGNGKNTTPPL